MPFLQALAFAAPVLLVIFVIWRIVRTPSPPDPFLHDMRKETSSWRGRK